MSIAGRPPEIWENASESFPPRCLRCAYVLTGLPSGRCPECGQFFDPAVPSTFTRKPPLIGWKLWLPGLLLGLGGGFLLAVALVSAGNWGYALWVAMPFAAGAVLGYRVRSGGCILALLALVVIVGLIFGLANLNLAGVYCGIVLGMIFVGPVMVGAMLGAVLRITLRATNFSQRWHLPIWVFLALPLVAGLIEGRPSTRQANETITTSVLLPVDADRAFDAIMFYEEVRHRPPLILRIGLAHPLFTRGSSQRIGDMKTCVYNKGHITKRITDLQPGRRLAFEVIEQNIGYEIDVRLVGGSFEFAPQPDGRALVRLTTEYEPLLRPRWCWRAFERYAVHTLHKHVIEGMRRRAADEDTGTIEPVQDSVALIGGARAR